MFTNLIKRTTALAASVFLVAGLLTACSIPLPNGSGECTFTVDYPHGSTKVAGFMDGKGKAKCVVTSGALTNLRIETRLQRWSGSAWITMTGSTVTTTINTVKSGVTYTGVSGFVICQSGTFRTQSRGSAQLDGKPAQSLQWQTTNTKKGVKNPCTKPTQIVTV